MQGISIFETIFHVFLVELSACKSPLPPIFIPIQITTELQAHSKTLQDQGASAARDVAILKDMDKEYAKQGQAKTKEVRCGPGCRILHPSSMRLRYLSG